MSWIAYNNGQTIGMTGSENGIILRDEEHTLGARISLEEKYNIAPYTVTCGVYGSILHTIFRGTREQAEDVYKAMKNRLAIIATADWQSDDYQDQIDQFVADFY